MIPTNKVKVDFDVPIGSLTTKSQLLQRSIAMFLDYFIALRGVHFCSTIVLISSSNIHQQRSPTAIWKHWPTTYKSLLPISIFSWNHQTTLPLFVDTFATKVFDMFPFLLFSFSRAPLTTAISLSISYMLALAFSVANAVLWNVVSIGYFCSLERAH